MDILTYFSIGTGMDLNFFYANSEELFWKDTLIFFLQ